MMLQELDELILHDVESTGGLQSCRYAKEYDGCGTLLQFHHAPITSQLRAPLEAISLCGHVSFNFSFGYALHTNII